MVWGDNRSDVVVPCLIGIQDCVLRGKVSEALKLVRIAYPGILDKNKQLLFKLKCRQFVEMIGGCDKMVETINLSCSSELGSSSNGTPPPRDVTTSPSHDQPPSLSPHSTDSAAGNVFDNGEVSCCHDDTGGVCCICNVQPGVVNGDSVDPAMEVDAPLLHISVEPPLLHGSANGSAMTPLTTCNQSQCTLQDRHVQAPEVRHHRVQGAQEVPENFELTTEQIKRILTFGKDLQRLYDSIAADGTHDKLKVLLQVHS